MFRRLVLFVFMLFLSLSLVSSALTDNLQNYWAFEEGAGDFLDQVSSNDLVEAGTVGRVSGKIGQGVEFNDKKQNRLETESNIGITGSTSRSICWWSEQDGTTNHEVFVSWGVNSNYAKWIVMFYDLPSHHLNVQGHLIDFFTTIDTTTNMDFHCVVYNSANDHIEWWRNGVSIDDHTFSNAPNTIDTHLFVGKHIHSDSYPFDGIMDELGIWTTVLTEANILELYNGGDGLTYPFVSDTCSCPGLNEDWEIDMSDYCVISDACDLGTGTLSFTDVGNATCDAVISSTGLGYPGLNSILYLNDDCIIWV